MFDMRNDQINKVMEFGVPQPTAFTNTVMLPLPWPIKTILNKMT